MTVQAALCRTWSDTQIVGFQRPLCNQSADDVIMTMVCSLRKRAHAIYRNFLALKIENFQLKNFDIFLIFAQIIDCGYTLEPPRRGGSNEYPLTSTHNLYFGAKIGIPLHTPVLLYKSGV